MTAFRFPWDEAPVRPSRPREAKPSISKRPRGRPKEAPASHPGADAPAAAAGYVERAFGEDLAAVRQAMEALAASMEPEELNRVSSRLYEHFRPEVPAGAKNWGAKGVLDLAKIRSAVG